MSTTTKKTIAFVIAFSALAAFLAGALPAWGAAFPYNPTNNAPDMRLANPPLWRVFLGNTNELDIRDFGAIAGDGGDDSAAVQAAIDCATTGAVKTVYFPAGKYRLTQPVTVIGYGVSIAGSDRGSSIVEIDGAINGFCLGDGSGWVGSTYTNSQTYFRNLTIRAVTTNALRGIWGRGWRDADIKDVTVTGPLVEGTPDETHSFTEAAIDLDDCWSLSFRDVGVYRASGDAFRFGLYANAIQMNECIVTDCFGIGYNFAGLLNGIKLSGCRAETVKLQGMRFSGPWGNNQVGNAISILGGYLENCALDATGKSRNMIELDTVRGVSISGVHLNQWDARTNVACIGFTNLVGASFAANFFIPFFGSDSYGIVNRGGTNRNISLINNAIWVYSAGLDAGYVDTNRFDGEITYGDKLLIGNYEMRSNVTVFGTSLVRGDAPYFGLDLTNSTSYSKIIFTERGYQSGGILQNGSGTALPSMYLFTGATSGPIRIAAGLIEGLRANTSGTLSARTNIAVGGVEYEPRFLVDVRMGTAPITLPAGSENGIVVDNYSGDTTNQAAITLAGSAESGYGTYAGMIVTNRGEYSVLALRLRDGTSGVWTNGLTIDGQTRAVAFSGPVTVEGNTVLTNVPAHNQDASTITTGTFDDSRIPNLAGEKITSGTIPVGRLPGTSAAGYVLDTISGVLRNSSGYVTNLLVIHTAFTIQNGSVQAMTNWTTLAD